MTTPLRRTVAEALALRASASEPNCDLAACGKGQSCPKAGTGPPALRPSTVQQGASGPFGDAARRRGTLGALRPYRSQQFRTQGRYWPTEGPPGREDLAARRGELERHFHPRRGMRRGWPALTGTLQYLGRGPWGITGVAAGVVRSPGLGRGVLWIPGCGILGVRVWRSRRIPASRSRHRVRLPTPRHRARVPSWRSLPAHTPFLRRRSSRLSFDRR